MSGYEPIEKQSAAKRDSNHSRGVFRPRLADLPSETITLGRDVAAIVHST